MTQPKLEQAGGCHCGLLRYRVAAPPLDVYAFHCTDCQTLSGSVFGIGVMVREASFTLTGVPHLVRRVLGNGRAGNRWIGPDCGVWLCGSSRSNPATGLEQRNIRGGTFDDTS